LTAEVLEDFGDGDADVGIELVGEAGDEDGDLGHVEECSKLGNERINAGIAPHPGHPRITGERGMGAGKEKRPRSFSDRGRYLRS
jgi:hypothetical protein